MSLEKIVWSFIDQQFEQEPSWKSIRVATLEEISKAENAIKLKFHEDYKKYLKKYGGGSPFAYDIYGLHPTLITLENYSVVYKTNLYHDQNWPYTKKWYIVSTDHFGNPIGIDPEGKVWLSDHDSDFDQVKLADNFEEFLYKLYTDTLYQ